MAAKKKPGVDSKAKFVRVERAITEEISHFLFALGNQFVSVKNADAAFDCFKYSVDLNSLHQPSVYNLGALYSTMGNLEGARRMFAEAVRMRSADTVARIALGEVTRKLGMLDEAAEILEPILHDEPNNYIILSAMAVLRYDQGRLAEAAEFNNGVIAKQPTDIHAGLNRALINMTFGRWSDWWSQYEYFLSYGKNEKMRGLKMIDAWAGQEMESKTLLVVSDQGSGDAIQFSRYLKDAKEMGKFARVIYLLSPDLKDLLHRVDGVDEVVGFGERMKIDYDAFASLLGIMRVLQVSPENCLRPPHVVTDPSLDEVWKIKVLREWTPGRKKIGIVWAGDPRHGNDGSRSISLAKLLKVVDSTAVNLYSFQVGAAVNQVQVVNSDEAKVIDLGSDFRNFDDTASALRMMDLVISVDTSVPHLAGCMGIPTWLLLPDPPEWRHLLVGHSSPWYENVKIFRQGKPKDWDSVVRTLRMEMESYIGRQ